MVDRGVVSTALRFGYVDTALGQIHYRTAGVVEPLTRTRLLLHWTPGSSAPYDWLLPEFARRGFRAFAPDLPGDGASFGGVRDWSIEDYAAAGCRRLAFDELVEDKLGGLGNAAIRAFLSDNWNGLQFLFAEISRFQWDHFQEMIPVAFRAIWSKGLNSPHFRLKLCGAGGGGFLLGMAPDLETAKKELAPHRIIPVHRWD